jgi:hypothetical protein
MVEPGEYVVTLVVGDQELRQRALIKPMPHHGH